MEFQENLFGGIIIDQKLLWTSILTLVISIYIKIFPKLQTF